MGQNVEYKKGGKATEGVKTSKISYVALVCALFSLFIFPGVIAIILAAVDLIMGKVKNDGRNVAVSGFALLIAGLFVGGYLLTPSGELNDKEKQTLGMETETEGEMPSQEGGDAVTVTEAQ